MPTDSDLPQPISSSSTIIQLYLLFQKKNKLTFIIKFITDVALRNTWLILENDLPGQLEMNKNVWERTDLKCSVILKECLKMAIELEGN